MKKEIRAMKMLKSNSIKIVILTIGISWLNAWGTEYVKQDEFITLKEKNFEEFKQISIALTEIKNDMGHIQQDLTELKDLRRSIFDRMLDIILAGGLAFTGAKVLRRKNDKKNSQINF